MNRFARLSLGLAIFLTAPGLAPYQAFAQVVTGRVAASAPGSAAAGAIGAPGATVSLPAANLPVTLLAPSLTPASAPVLKTVSVGMYAIPYAANDAARPLALVPAAIGGRALPLAAVKAVPVAAEVPTASRVLTEGAARLEAASKPGSESTPSAALDAIFEGPASRRSALDDAPLAAASESGRNDLRPSSAREPAKGPRWVEKFNGDPAPSGPRRSLKRTLSVGFIAAVVPIAFTMGAVAIASALGYDLHPNYQGPVGENVVPNLVQAIAIWIGAAIMAPVSEEAIFRGGLQGTLARISAKLRLGDFVVPALITSVLFTLLHETSDPLLIATRLAHAFILSYVYKKEGILASMAAHGFFNGLLALSLVFGALHAPLLSILAAPVSLYVAWRARKFLKTQKDDVASGALAPLQMSGTLALIFALVLMLGYFFIMPNIFWPIGAVALAYNGIKKLKSGK